jgi:peptidoglycan/LPS O-acetylase OafA/YrhL
MVKNLRTEIQSLRGLAVILVVIFHFFPDILPRGYLGVDIFFVISGFLMSKIISENIIKKKFNLLDFYLNRFKRILPSLLLVILAVYLISIFILLPNDIDKLYESIKYTFLFIPNIYFWLNGGYFGLVDELKPLLHLWSIGIEFQFYFTIPILYIIFNHYFKIKKIIYFLIFTLVASYLLNFYLDFIVGKNFTFFFFFSRLWEFLIGSLCFHLAKKKYIKDDIFILIASIIFSFVLFYGFSNEILNKTFASLFAFTIIFFNPRVYLIKIFINQKILVFFGLISYALYLWHWPIISLFKYFSIVEINLIKSIFLIFLSIIFAFLTTKYLEDKLRFNLKKKYNFIFSLLIIVLVMTIDPQSNNFRKDKINKNVLNISESIGSNFRCKTKDFVIYGKSKACLINSNLKKIEIDKKNYIALYGNSHAQMYGYAFENILKKNKNTGIIIPLNGCLPTFDLNISENCLNKSQKNFQKIIVDKNIKTILIGLNYNHMQLIDNDGNIYTSEVKKKLTISLQNLIDKLIKNNKKVILIGPISIPKYNFPLDYSRNIFFKKNLDLIKNYPLEKFIKENYIFIDSFKNTKNFRYFLPHNIQCNKKYCEYIIENQSVFADDNHLSRYGSLIMQNKLKKEIEFLN